MTNLPQTTAVALERDADWLTIWLDQPDKKNALTDDLRSDVIAAIEAVRDDASVRGITIRGRGGVFCAGGDMKQFRGDFQTSASLEDIRAMSREAAQVMRIVHEAPQVTIALVEGAAMAGGFGLMCCADIVIAQSDAMLGMSECMIGLSPAQISPYVIERIGRSRGRRLMLTAERLTGSQGERIGLVDYTGADLAECEACEAMVKSRVRKCAPRAVAETKHLIAQLPAESKSEEIELCADLFARQMQGEEAREGVASFLEKRPAKWARKEASQ